MRTTRILRAVAQQARFLEAGAPTGLTGLLTHETPRASLIYVYHNTLQKLKHLPESSVYRQSTEALTKHRLSIIEGVRPQGLEEWRSRVKSTIEAHPEAFQAVAAQANPEDVNYIAHEFRTRPEIEDSKSSEPARERTPEERAEFIHNVMEHNRQIEEELSAMEPEPPLSAEQYASSPWVPDDARADISQD